MRGYAGTMNAPAFLKKLLRHVVPPTDDARAAERQARKVVAVCQALLSERGEVWRGARPRSAYRIRRAAGKCLQAIYRPARGRVLAGPRRNSAGRRGVHE